MAPQHHRVYYEASYLNTLKTHIVEEGEDALGFYVIPEQTIFHPRGGGQPRDEGFLVCGECKHLILDLANKVGYVRHYIGDRPLGGSLVGREVEMWIDMEKRRLYAQYHTAGHCIADVITEEYPDLVGYKGNHYPCQGALLFKRRAMGKERVPKKEDFVEYDLTGMQTRLIDRLTAWLMLGSTVKANYVGDQRMVRIEGMQACPCGGTHVDNISEIGSIQIKKIRFKKGEGLKISYSARGAADGR